MAKSLTDIIDPQSLDITLADIAQAVKKPVEKLYYPKKCDSWKWPYMFLIVVEGEGGLFGSYRALLCWLEAVIQLLTSCNNSQKLGELIELVEWELQNYAYSDTNKARLQEVLQGQKVRREDLKAKAISDQKAWEWARLWERMIKMCQDEESLRLADNLFKAQRMQYAKYPGVIKWVQQVGQQRWASLQSF